MILTRIVRALDRRVSLPEMLEQVRHPSEEVRRASMELTRNVLGTEARALELAEHVDKGWLQVRTGKLTPLNTTLGLRSGTCLEKSLLLASMLGAVGIPSTTHFGVKKERGELIGHCWLSVEGRNAYFRPGFLEIAAVSL